jgi:hypothetical protein
MGGLCTFCDNPLDDSIEHVVLSAIGGRKCSARVICGDHNNTFGSTIDKVLTEQLAFFCNLLAIRTGRNQTAATIRGLQTTDGVRVDLEPGGRPVQRAAIKDEPRADGKRQIRITANNVEQLRHLTEQYMRRYPGRSLDNATILQTIERLSSPVEYSGEIGGEAALRAIAKMGLLLLASEIGTDAVRGLDTAPIRTFITIGGQSEDHVRMDYATAFPEVLAFASFPFYSHQIGAIADPTSGVACAFVKIFGTFRYNVLISDAWSGPAKSIFYAVDPVTGTHDEVNLVVNAPIFAQSHRHARMSNRTCRRCSRRSPSALFPQATPRWRETS